MNYSMTLTGNMNLRSTASSTGTILKLVPTGTKLEGDILSADGRWLNVALIDSIQTTVPTWVATYTTSGKLVTNPIPPVYPDFVLELSFSSDSEISITLPDGAIQKFPSGLVKISASNPTMQLV